MRENRTYGSEGGEGQILPDPYPPARHGVHHAARKCAWSPPSPPSLRSGPSPAVRERGDPARSAGVGEGLAVARHTQSLAALFSREAAEPSVADEGGADRATT